MKTTRLNFNDVLKKVMKDYGFTFLFLSNVLKCSVSSINSYVSGKSNMSLKKAILLKQYIEDTYSVDFLEKYIFSLGESNYYYHGSRSGIKGEIVHDYSSGRKRIDFGQGFYLGETFKQSSTFVSEEDGKERIYKLSFDKTNLNCKLLEGLDWIFFIGYNRGKIPEGPKYKKIINKMKSFLSSNYDVLYGEIADDKMSMNMEEFFANRLTYEQLEKCLTRLRLGKQYCLKTKRACDSLEIVEVYELDDVYRYFIHEYAASSRNEAVEDSLNIAKANVKGLKFEDLLEKYGNE